MENLILENEKTKVFVSAMRENLASACDFMVRGKNYNKKLFKTKICK